jgi:DNA helicase-2/ATP-dependent DNA helicase PcrA
MISLAGLNSEQRQAAETIEGPVLILAGAGSGKTRTITYRISHMVANLDIPPRSILAVSFTNKAAKEMQERVTGLLGKRRMKGMTLATFHSLGVRILKKELHRLGYAKKFSIYDSSDQLAIIRDALKNYRSEKAAFDRKTILSRISFLKNQNLGPEEFSQSAHFDPFSPYDIATEYCYRYYQERLKFFSAIDFDDILFLVVRLFREYPELKEVYSKKYQYIMIDEYQDTNALQFELVLALTETHNNLCVVGDDDQSIYAFRGADVENILSFEKNFPTAKVVKLEQNYRSTTHIIELANKVIVKNKKRRDKTLRANKESDVIPKLWVMADSDHEAQVVVDDIFQYQKKGGHLGDIAILYRSNTQTQVFEEQLREMMIPYRMLGGQKLYERKEIKDIMAYLALLYNRKDELAFRRVLNTPPRGIGLRTLEKMLDYSKDKNIPLTQTLTLAHDIVPSKAKDLKGFHELLDELHGYFDRNSLEDALRSMIDRLDFHNYIRHSYDTAKQVERKRKDIEFFIESAARFEKYHNDKATLDLFVEKIILQDGQDNVEEENEEDEDVRRNEVTMMTLHSSKGLEFEKVYLVGMEEELIPHKRTITEGDDISEELRLCYVGITRAKDELIMSYCKKRKIHGRDYPRMVSRFISDQKDLYQEVDKNDLSQMEEADRKEYTKSFFSNLLDNLDE